MHDQLLVHCLRPRTGWTATDQSDCLVRWRLRSPSATLTPDCSSGFFLGWKPGRCGPAGDCCACRSRLDVQVCRAITRPALFGTASAKPPQACLPARGDVGALALSVKREPQHVASGWQRESWSFMPGERGIAGAHVPITHPRVESARSGFSPSSLPCVRSSSAPPTRRDRRRQRRADRRTASRRSQMRQRIELRGGSR